MLTIQQISDEINGKKISPIPSHARVRENVSKKFHDATNSGPNRNEVKRLHCVRKHVTNA